MTEEAILQGCLQNNAAAQKALYEKYSAKMLVVCYRYAHNREDAEDMLQEGLIKVFFKINIFKKKKRFNENVDIIHASGLQVREESIPSIIQAKEVVECIRMLPIGYRT